MDDETLEAAAEEAQDIAEDAQGADGEQAQDSDVTDSHGQPGINKERHDREVAALNREIDELKAKIAENAKTEEGRAALEKEVADLKAKMADSEVSHRLQIAGCIDEKAAKSRLEDFGGDVSKLKEQCPYLFRQERKGTTGLPPAGASQDDADEKLDRAFGLKK